MKILVLEDGGTVSHGLVAALQAEGHSVSEAGWVYDAISHWTRERHDCLIVDLNMVTNGLKPEEAEKTYGGLLTGWKWLLHYVFPTDETLKERTLIYTRYFKEFQEYVPEDERAGVAVISKNADHAAAQVLGFVRKIARDLGETSHEAR